jgi:acyl-CoA synthetase (AMP-forming)/AMP-acid ligase II
MNTHRSVGTAFAHLLMALHYPADMPPVNLAAAPMTHSAGALTMPCSARGGTVVVLASPDPVSLLDTIERHRVTELFLPPTVIYRLIEMDGIRERDFSSLRYLIYGSAPMAVEKLKAAIDVFGPVLIESYGQTEAPMAIAYLRPEEHLEAGGPLACDERLASCGRPAPLIRVEIRDDGGGVLGPGETGEICVAGDLVMKGYHDDPSRTADAIRDGWLHTGDVGHLDAHGYLHITDRKKDMIITGGFNVYPAEVEQALFTHPAVADCAVIGIPDSDWGELVTAIVECAPGTDVDEPELIALCKARLDSVRAPKHVEFVTALPRNANGKVVKRDLRDRFATSLPGAQP